MRISDWSSDVCSSDLRQAVLAGEVEIALVVRRAAEDGAAAILHQHEVGDIDRQLHVRQEGMPGLQAGVETPLLGGRYRFFAGAEAVALGDEGRRRRIVRRQRDRSEERRVGKEWGRTCRSRGSP